MEHDLVNVGDGLRLHCRRAGSASHAGLLLLHGFPQTGHAWRKVLPELAGRFHCVAPDLRGCGDSDAPADGYDKRQMARDVASIIEHFELGPAVVVGHDRGARVAHRLALDHPRLVRRLVLLDIAPTAALFEHLDLDRASELWPWFFHNVPDLPEVLIRGREEAYVRHCLEAWSHDRGAFEPEAVAEYVRCLKRPGVLRAALADYRALRTDLAHDAADAGRRVACPTTVLWGAGGRPPQAPDMLAAWRDRCEMLDGQPVAACGHFIAEEAPAAVVAALAGP